MQFTEEADPIAGVSVVMPAYNAANYIAEALESIIAQDTRTPLETIVVDDGSTDGTLAIVDGLAAKFAAAARPLRVLRLASNGGAAAARNAGVAAATHDWICCADADDVARPRRVAALVAAARGAADRRRTLFGSRFAREPADATARYATWANELPQDRLKLECFREVTLLQPTWFFCKELWEAAGRYDGDTCDDLRFFLRHVTRGGSLRRVDEDLVVYRHVSGSLSFTTSRAELVRQRVDFFARSVLDGAWADKRVRVWGAGRDGRAFFNELARRGYGGRVAALHDVDAAKLGTYHNGATGASVAVLPVDAIAPPFVVCVAPRDPAFLAKVRAVAGRLGAIEGADYWHFN